jgi:undecaprenyl diphosphate synthase
MNKEKDIPRHIAIIMDGNGRWAQARKLPRVLGHREGAFRVKDIVNACNDLGVGFLTLYAFSTENWSRPKSEVDMLMRYFEDFLSREMARMHKDNIRFKVIGRREPLPQRVLAQMRKAVEKTRDNTGLTLVLALNYGSRQEIVDGIRKFAEAFKKGKAELEDIGEDNFGEYLYTAGIPDPDLLIRTSGEVRLSNFLLWQLSYAEMYFTKKFWPDFRKKDLEEAIEEYHKRHRKFGAI